MRTQRGTCGDAAAMAAGSMLVAVGACCRCHSGGHRGLFTYVLRQLIRAVCSTRRAHKASAQMCASIRKKRCRPVTSSALRPEQSLLTKSEQWLSRFEGCRTSFGLYSQFAEIITRSSPQVAPMVRRVRLLTLSSCPISRRWKGRKPSLLLLRHRMPLKKPNLAANSLSTKLFFLAEVARFCVQKTRSTVAGDGSRCFSDVFWRDEATRACTQERLWSAAMAKGSRPVRQGPST